MDEVTAAYSVAFTRDGMRLLGGYNNMIRIFDTSRPGRFYTEIVTHSRRSPGLQGAPHRGRISLHSISGPSVVFNIVRPYRSDPFCNFTDDRCVDQ